MLKKIVIRFIMLQESGTIILGRNIKFFPSVSMAIPSNRKFIFCLSNVLRALQLHNLFCIYFSKIQKCFVLYFCILFVFLFFNQCEIVSSVFLFYNYDKLVYAFCFFVLHRN